MTFRTTMKQMARTPWKTLFFFLLLALGAAMLATGLNLFLSNLENERKVDALYTTVGTIDQMPDSTERVSYPVGDEVFFYDEPRYLTEISEEKFQGLPTKLPVENRPVLYCKGEKEDGKPMFSSAKGPQYFALVFTPDAGQDLELLVGDGMNTYVPCHGVRYTSAGPVHKEETVTVSIPTDMLDSGAVEAGVPYVILCDFWEMREFQRATPQAVRWLVSADAYSVEYDGLEQRIFPYEEGFFDTETGKRLLALADSSHESAENTFLAVPTNGLNLLAAFREGLATVKEGRAITEEEFASGAKVCMLPEKLMRNYELEDNNELQIGDKISLSALGKLYGVSPSSLGYASGTIHTLPAVTGSPAALTDLGDYEIVGSYYISFNNVEGVGPPGDYYNGYPWVSGQGCAGSGLGYNEVLFPTKSADLSQVPILYGSYLISDNVSFELENGMGPEFLSAFQDLGYDMLQVTLDDQGYSTIKKGLDAVQLVALILLSAGAASTLALLVFFVYLQISRQKREAAVQISLGAGKRRCAQSLLLGVMLVVVLGTAAGSLTGHFVTERLSLQVYEQAKNSGYSREYSDQMDSSGDVVFDYSAESSPVYSLLAGLSVSAAALLLSMGMAWRVLRQEPLALLAQKEKE